MYDKKLDEIIQSVVTIAPLFKKKIIRHGSKCPNDPFNHSHFQIMAVLKEEGVLPISEIGKKLFISTPNMTKLLVKLIDEDMVVRIPDKKDRRIINIQLTQKGDDYLESKFNNMNSRLKERLSMLTDDQINRLHNSLENLKDVLNEISSED